MNDFALFLGKFLRHGTTIASVAPSSRFLSRTTLRNIDWERATAVIELGAGTGPITRVIAERAKPDCRVVVVEQDRDWPTSILSRGVSRISVRSSLTAESTRLTMSCRDCRFRRSHERCGMICSGPWVPSCGPRGRTIRSPRFRGSTGDSTAGFSGTSSLHSSCGTYPPRGRIFARMPDRFRDGR
jgi:hypothetical protein